MLKVSLVIMWLASDFGPLASWKVSVRYRDIYYREKINIFGFFEISMLVVK